MMGLLDFLWDLSSPPFMVFLCLLCMVIYGILVKLDTVAAEVSPSEKENLYRKKKSGVKVKLGGEGSIKGGVAKKSRKKKRVKFMDDVELVRESNDVECVGLCEGPSEKVGFLANSLEGRLIVGREDECNLMEDDVVVFRSAYHFGDSNKPTEVIEASGEISLKNGSEKIVVDEESEVMYCVEISVDGCDEVNVIKDVESADGSKNIRTQAEAEVATENSEVTDYYCVKVSHAVTSCPEEFPVDKEIRNDIVAIEDRLESMNDNEMVEKCSDDAAAGKRVANNAEFSGKELGLRSLDDKNGLNLTSVDVAIDDIDANMTGRVAYDPELLEEEMERHTVLDEDRASSTNDDIGSDETIKVVGKQTADNGGHLGDELDGEAVEGQQRFIINSAVAINESDAAAGEIDAGKSEFSEESGRDAVEEICDKFSGGEEDKIHLRTNGFENWVFEEEKNYEKFCKESNVELVSDNVADPLTVTGTVVHEEEGIGKDEDFYDDGDNEDGDDDDWEGVERSQLEKVFAEAVNYVEYKWKLKDHWSANSRSDIPKRLYGLHKLTIRGPCNVPPPMALKVTARAKWNAWRSLGNMSPEVAMEEYIKILSDADPGWMLDSTAEGNVSLEAGVEGSPYPTSSEELLFNFDFGRTKLEKA